MLYVHSLGNGVQCNSLGMVMFNVSHVLHSVDVLARHAHGMQRLFGKDVPLSHGLRGKTDMREYICTSS